MTDLTPSVFIVTSTSGTGTSDALKRATNGNPALVTLRVEDGLCQVVQERYANGRRPELQSVFQHHEETLRGLWPESFKRVADQAKEYVNAGRDVIIAMNTSWFHVEAQSMLLPVSAPTILETGLRIPHIITLIDDVYDVFFRLTRPRYLFYPQLDTRIRYRSSVLRKLLEWREFEVREAERLARELDLPHYLFAIKNTVSSFLNLLKPLPKTAYISHPISDVRAAGDEAVAEFADIVHEVSAQLERDDYSVLEPTSIDEFRLRQEDASGQGTLSLAPRWPCPDKVLWVPAEGACLTSPSDNFWDEVRGAHEPGDWHEDNFDSVQAFSDEIQRQVNWRDRKLVEQANDLVVLQPFYSRLGHSAGSVRIEVDLRRDRDVATKQQTRYAVWHSGQAERRRRVGALVVTLRSLPIIVPDTNWEEELREKMLSSSEPDVWPLEGDEYELGRILLEAVRKVLPRLRITPDGGYSHMSMGQAASRQAEIERRVAGTLRKELASDQFRVDRFGNSRITADRPSGGEIGRDILRSFKERS